MLRIGLTGGIGSGKSTVAAAFVDLGAVVVDADVVAREVVEPGSPGLAAVQERFGPEIVTGEGALDRAALASRVFGDEAARGELEAILHPLIRDRTEQLVAAAGEDAVIVHDVPLLVEKRMGSAYHLVLVVEASVPTRLERLAGRGMSESDARARMSHQASDDQRRAAADIVLSNDGDRNDLRERLETLWHERLRPYSENLRARRIARPDVPVLADPDPRWEQTATRLTERLGAVLLDRAPAIEHVGSTSVPGMRAKDVIDLQVGVRTLRDADDPAFVEALTRAGFPRVEDYRTDHPTGDLTDPELWIKRFHGSCDPGRVVHLHVREIGSAGWDYALLFRDWLRACPTDAREYEQVKAELFEEHGAGAAYSRAKAPWFEEAWPRMQAWARRSGWHD